MERINSLDTFMNVWYSKVLEAMQEPSLDQFPGKLALFGKPRGPMQADKLYDDSRGENSSNAVFP